MKEPKEPAERRGVITAENVDESRRLKALWERSQHGMTQDAFAEAHGIGGQSAVTNMLNAKMAITLKGAVGFAAGLGCKISDFSERLAAEQLKLTAGLHNISTRALVLAVTFDELPESVKDVALAKATQVLHLARLGIQHEQPRADPPKPARPRGPRRPPGKSRGSPSAQRSPEAD